MERKKMREKRAVAKIMERVVLESLSAAGDGAEEKSGGAGEVCIFFGRGKLEVVLCNLSYRFGDADVVTPIVLSFDFIFPKKILKKCK